MATTQDYINQLKIDKENLVSMLNNMGVEASNNESFTSLTPKVGKIVYAPRGISFYQFTGNDLSEEVANLDTTNITSMNSMFENCQQITSLDLTNFNTKNVLYMQRMFWACNQLTELNLSTWDTSQVVDMMGMFYACSSLQRLDIRSFTFTKVGSWISIFYNVPTDCLIIVKDDTAKAWVLKARSDLTNVKTVAEL